MTTIATDGRSIAADSQTTWGGQFRSPSAPKIKVAHGRVYAVAGMAGLLDALIAWHHAGAAPGKVPEKADFSMLVCDGKTVHFLSNEAPYAVQVPVPWAIGSGWEVALGVMLQGGSPRRAVDLVKQHHVLTGGDIQVIDIGEALGPPVRGTVSAINPETGKRKIRLAEKVE